MSAANHPFHLFPALPVEIRLKIWRLTCHSRVAEVQLHVPSGIDPASTETPLDLRPFARPSLPIIFQICRESRDEALSIYRPCSGSTFASPYLFPYNLYNPVLDTLFIPMSLYSMQACQPQNMFSSVVAQALGTPREFILDRLALSPDDVRPVRSLAISWADMHIKDASALLEALEPFTSLRELSLLFFEVRQDRQDIRLMSMKKGQMRAILVDPSESTVRGRYLERVLEEFTELSTTFNEAFVKANIERRTEGRGGRKRLPKVTIKMVRFEP